MGRTSACGATGASGPVLGGDRSRGIERKAAVEAGVLPSIGVRWFRKGGGMPPLILAPVSGRYLSFAEREEIAVLLAGGCGVREIARQLGRAPSTISRELQRNAALGPAGLSIGPRPPRRMLTVALDVPSRRSLRSTRSCGAMCRTGSPGPCSGPTGASRVRRSAGVGGVSGPRKDRRWGQCWSPEQISGRLRVDFPDDESMRVSHEAIYQSLYVQGRGALRRELTACLRTGRALGPPGTGRRGATGAS